MAMLPFCGINMADYFAHWLSVGRRASCRPRIFHVNWFRTDDKGRFLWPGFGENIRVLKWILERVDGVGGAVETPIGNAPSRDAIDLTGLDIGAQRFEELVAVDPGAWLEEAKRNEAFLDKFENRLPSALRSEHEALVARLRRARTNAGR
jgi:phosphoenolpyruvate carboxykinase (GTP)